MTLRGSDCDLDGETRHPAIRGGNDKFDFQILVAMMGRTRVDQRYVVSHFGGDVGEFATAFPDLAKATINRQDTDLTTLTAQINGEASKSSDVFDAFGIKFPIYWPLRFIPLRTDPYRTFELRASATELLRTHLQRLMSQHSNSPRTNQR
jgi:hypothetical protein